jgi:hypothetical protein
LLDIVPNPVKQLRSSICSVARTDLTRQKAPRLKTGDILARFGISRILQAEPGTASKENPYCSMLQYVADFVQTGLIGDYLFLERDIRMTWM